MPSRNPSRSRRRTEPEPEPSRCRARPGTDRRAPVDAGVPAGGPPLTMREMFARVEPALRTRSATRPALPSRAHERPHRRRRLDAQADAVHIAAWHDLTTDRLIKMAIDRPASPLDREQQAINAAAARGHRQDGRRGAQGHRGEFIPAAPPDAAHDRRASCALATVGRPSASRATRTSHYAEHMADLVPPGPLAGKQRRSADYPLTVTTPTATPDQGAHRQARPRRPRPRRQGARARAARRGLRGHLHRPAPDAGDGRVARRSRRTWTSSGCRSCPART